MKGILVSSCGYMCLACIYCLAEYFPGTFLYLEANTLIMQLLFGLSILFNITAIIFAVAGFSRMSSLADLVMGVLSLMVSLPYVVAIMILMIHN